MKSIAVASVLCALVGNSPAFAGGFLADIVSGAGNIIAPGSDMGKPLDDLNRELKENVPIYGTVEEGASGAVRNVAREFTVETAGPALAGMIEVSRQDALRGGVSDVPPDIRNVLGSYFKHDVASGVRYRIGQGGDLALASNAFRYGDAVAITLGDIIVFRDHDAASDLAIWAHEMNHVIQYRNWGMLDFAKRYVRDHGAVENEAYSLQENFINWYNSNNNVAANNYGSMQPVSLMPQGPQLSNVCGTPFGMCVLPGIGAVGQGCFCGSFQGPIQGQVVP